MDKETIVGPIGKQCNGVPVQFSFVTCILFLESIYLYYIPTILMLLLSYLISFFVESCLGSEDNLKNLFQQARYNHCYQRKELV